MLISILASCFSDDHGYTGTQPKVSISGAAGVTDPSGQYVGGAYVYSGAGL